MFMTEGLFWYLMLFVAFTGLSVGSFLNVVIYRVPVGRSIASPGSACGSCNHPIRFYDNIPVLSWCILRGRCRDCGAKISPRYALVEALTGIIACFIWWQIPQLLGRVGLPSTELTLQTFGILFLLKFFFASLLITITFIDFDHFIIPHRFTLLGMISGVASPWILQGVLGPAYYLAYWPPVMPIMSIVGMLAGGLLIVTIFYLYLMIRGAVGIGGGDVMLMAMVGAWLGIPGIIFVCFAASVQGILAAVVTSALGIRFVTDANTLLNDDCDDNADEDQSEDNDPPTSPPSDTTPLDDTTTSDSHTDPPPPLASAAIPFGPFIALAAFEFMLFGIWFPETLSMLPTFFLFF